MDHPSRDAAALESSFTSDMATAHTNSSGSTSPVPSELSTGEPSNTSTNVDSVVQQDTNNSAELSDYIIGSPAAAQKIVATTTTNLIIDSIPPLQRGDISIFIRKLVPVPNNVTIHVDGTTSTDEFGTEYLVQCSKYFADVLQGGWKESEQAFMHLPEMNPTVWQLFRKFISNAGEFDLQEEDIRHPGWITYTKDEEEYYKQGGGALVGGKRGLSTVIPYIILDRLIEGYQFGEYIQCPGFCNNIMDLLIIAYRKYYDSNDKQIPLWNLSMVFGDVFDNHGLQRFLADVLLFAMGTNAFQEAIHNKYLDKRSITAVALAGLRQKEAESRLLPDNPFDRTRCTYHNHPEGKFFTTCSDPFSKNNMGPAWITSEQASNLGALWMNDDGDW